MVDSRVTGIETRTCRRLDVRQRAFTGGAVARFAGFSPDGTVRLERTTRSGAPGLKAARTYASESS